MLINELTTGKKKNDLTDASTSALTLFDSFGKDIHKMLCETEHGQLLIKNGYEEDLKACAELNKKDVIPFYSGNAIKVLK